jgi:hypothetical protein
VTSVVDDTEGAAVMGNLLELPREIATAFFFAAAIGIATGTVAVVRTQRLAPALPVALAAFGLAALSFGYAIWRNRRWRSRRMFGPRSFSTARR